MQVQQGLCLGQGRYGTVYKATYNAETVAMKVFHAHWEECWKNEWELFQSVNLRDGRIVGFIAHDVDGRGGEQAKKIILMDYMDQGSLQQFLVRRKLQQKEALRLIGTLIQGVQFLHCEVRGSPEQIASVVHRDLSSTSVMVNADGACCITDFGMALSRSTRLNDRPEYNIVKRLQTPLYAPPEYVESFRNPYYAKQIDFEELMAGDIYSTALLFWEILNRVHDSRYTLALSPELSETFGVTSYSAINYDIMSRVHQLGLRPGELNSDWPASLGTLLAESWSSQWQNRLKALRIVKNLHKIFPDLEKYL